MAELARSGARPWWRSAFESGAGVPGPVEGGVAVGMWDGPVTAGGQARSRGGTPRCRIVVFLVSSHLKQIAHLKQEATQRITPCCRTSLEAVLTGGPGAGHTCERNDQPLCGVL